MSPLLNSASAAGVCWPEQQSSGASRIPRASLGHPSPPPAPQGHPELCVAVPPKVQVMEPSKAPYSPEGIGPQEPLGHPLGEASQNKSSGTCHCSECQNLGSSVRIMAVTGPELSLDPKTWKKAVIRLYPGPHRVTISPSNISQVQIFLSVPEIVVLPYP